MDEHANPIRPGHMSDNTYPGEDRETFMQRVRTALGRGHTQSPPQTPVPAVDDHLIRTARRDADPVDLFTRRAEEVGMSVRLVTSTDLAGRLAVLLDELKIKTAVIAAAKIPIGKVNAALAEANVQVLDVSGADGFDCSFDVDAGITDAQAAIAESGTLVCCADSLHGRGASLVPPIHIAIVRRGDIVSDLLDLWDRFDSTAMPSSIALITGPSKTADIEGELVKGVHGPGTVVVLVVTDE